MVNLRSIGGITFSSMTTLAVASVAALGIAYISPGGVAAAVQVDVASASAVDRDPIVWHVANDLSGDSCVARPGPRLTGGSHSLEVDEECAVVFDALDTAVVWEESLDGTVSLADPRGRPIVTFAPADGRALEAVQPAHAMLSLRRI